MGAPTIVLIVQLLSGVAGGNGAGALLKQFSLGWLGNSLAGLVGGALGGQLLLMLLRGAGHGRVRHPAAPTSAPSSPRSSAERSAVVS
jgi:uncharacterized membrane protein YeaQ/YmgE (transglycosylase-associated protein family)